MTPYSYTCIQYLSLRSHVAVLISSTAVARANDCVKTELHLALHI